MQFLVSSLSFGVLLLLIMGIALDGSSRLPIVWASGLMWMGLFFSVSIHLTRHDTKDRELGALHGLLLTPIDRSHLYYAKWISTSAVVCLSQSALVIAFFVIFNQPAPVQLGAFLLTLLGGVVGLTGVGTFVATLVSASSMRDTLVPLLLFPLTIPLFIALIRLTSHALNPLAAASSVWVEVILAYVVAFAILPWLLFEPLMEV